MGNKVYLVKCPETAMFNTSSPIDSQLDYLGGQNIPYLDHIELFKLKNEITKLASIFEKQHANTSIASDEASLISIHQQLIQLQHPNIIKYYGLYFDSELTTDLSVSKWYFEALWKTLKNYCNHHSSYKSLIPEKNLWQMLEQITLALHFLEQRKQWHSHIQPDQIYIDQKGQIKLIPLGVLRMMSGYSQVLKQTGQALLSPELISQLQLKNINPCHNPYKSDVYSLGMTLLELMTLKNSFECYSLNLKNPKILENIIEERLIEASNNGYSEDLISIVKNMLQKDENYRVSFSDILNFKSQNQSRQLNQFTPLRCSTNLNTPRQQKNFEEVQQAIPSPQPTIPTTNQQPQKPEQMHQQQSSLHLFQQLNTNERMLQEQLKKEQQVNLQLQQQLKQQQQMLQQQYQQQQKQQQIIEQQQQQILSVQFQIKQLNEKLQQSQKPYDLQINQQNSYQINPMHTPPITFSSPIKHTLDDFTENIEISNRVTQALAQSRQTIGKYQR